MGAVCLAPKRIAGGLVKAALEEESEPARVGGSGGQSGDRVAGLGRAQCPQQ